ncbi:hypothetical protein VHEMI04733 [[Torrubiella] hemipterigena]|nr:hypothetical protein VHEMI04733 [[Torrubiella] hemipterigena]
MEDYADHFNLRPRLRLNTTVTKVRRDEKANKWILDIEGSDPQIFDRVVMATGIQGTPHIPKIPGMELFAGNNVHSRAFKDPAAFKGKRVVVVGLANTGADTIDALCPHAKEVYISHGHGSIVFPRIGANGKPFDHSFSSRKLATSGFLAANFPKLHEFLMNSMLKKMQGEFFQMKPEWRLSPAPSIVHAIPVVSDNLVQNFTDGKVTSIPRISKVLGPTTLELEDGSKVEADSIVWCTGYQSDFRLIDALADPTRNTTPRWAAAKGSKGKPLPRLYQNVISEDYPDSLAFMGGVAFLTGVFSLYDLASMAVAQIWKGSSTLPSKQEMNHAIDKHHEHMCTIAEQGPVIPGWVEGSQWLDWANRMAGTGVAEHLGWGAEGWKFWMNDRELCSLLMDGLLSPHMYRLFDGKRKKWDGARAEIYRVNGKSTN